MAVRKRPDNAPERRLEADRRQLELLAAQCGEEAGLHRPLNDVTGGGINGIPEDTGVCPEDPGGTAAVPAGRHALCRVPGPVGPAQRANRLEARQTLRR